MSEEHRGKALWRPEAIAGSSTTPVLLSTFCAEISCRSEGIETQSEKGCIGGCFRRQSRKLG